MRSKRVDYLFNFSRDHVAPGEVRIIKDSAKDALSQKMLDEHLFDRFFRKVGINRLPAQCEEIIEGGTKPRVGLFLALDYVFDSVYHQVREGSHAYDLNRDEVGKKSWGEFNAEQQAMIVENWYAAGMSESDILADFPDLTSQDIRACLAFAAERERRLLSIPAA